MSLKKNVDLLVPLPLEDDGGDQALDLGGLELLLLTLGKINVIAYKVERDIYS